MTNAINESDLIVVFNTLLAYGLSGDQARALLRRLGVVPLEEGAMTGPGAAEGHESPVRHTPSWSFFWNASNAQDTEGTEGAGVWRCWCGIGKGGP